MSNYDYDHDDYESDYDFRTWNEKYHDDNTWQQDQGISRDLDGNPHIYFCEVCFQQVTVREIEGSTVFDRYSYIECAECGAGENHLSDVGTLVLKEGEK